MALLGSSIDPRLQLQDYSGIVNAAQIQAQGLASIGSQIEAAAQQYKQYKKEQADTQKRVKAAANLADSISALVPELKGPLGATVAQLKDPNLTLADKDALAQSISSTLQLGIGVVTGNKEMALKQEELGFRRSTTEAATNAQIIKDNQERQRQLNIATATTLGYMENLPNKPKEFIKTEFLDKGFPEEGAEYAKLIKEALDKGLEVKEIQWVQNGVPMKGLGQRRNPNEPFTPVSINLSIPQDERVQDVNNGLGVNANQPAQDNQLPVARPPGQGLVSPGVLPEKGLVGPQAGVAQGGRQQTVTSGIPIAPPMSVSDQIAIEKREEEKLAKQQAFAAVAEKSTRVVNLLTQLKNHPGFNGLFGFKIPIVPGTNAADAEVLFKQIEALGFMEAIKDMKGMGALSNAEGEKASAALIGISPKMSEQAARQKIDEVIGYIQKGQERLQSGSLVQPEASKQSPVGGANSFFNKFK